MAVVSYSRSSVYAATPQTDTYLDLWSAPRIAPSDTDSYLLVEQRYVHRPDLLSADLYGTPRLWWVFSMVNPDILKDPIYDLVADITLRVPTKASVQGFI